MILVSFEEKKAVEEKLPFIHIRRTVGQKSKRHRYYMEEHPKAMAIVRKMRGISYDRRREDR